MPSVYDYCEPVPCYTALLLLTTYTHSSRTDTLFNKLKHYLLAKKKKLTEPDDV